MKILNCGVPKLYFNSVVLLVALLASSCRDPDVDGFVYDPAPYPLTIPERFPAMDIPADNPLTVKGVQLGKMLFYEPLLSGNGTQSCASCHAQSFGFTDNNLALSIGIDGLAGSRNSMALLNIGWSQTHFWDGRKRSLEDQAFEPVRNPIEMHHTWNQAVAKLQAHRDYPRMFGEAFGTDEIDSTLVVKAIAQFERTLISGNSRYDRRLRGELNLTVEQRRGEEIFFSEQGDCFHCHGNILFTDNLFHNNGLDSFFLDQGRAAITGDPNDEGKFKTPTLRNLIFTAPYMHDGRFQTLEEVVEFYTAGLKFSPTIDPLMTKVNGRADLSDQDKSDLIEFLKALTDSSFVTNPEFANPF